MGQLQGDLDEGIRTGAALLYQTFAKVIEGHDVRVHVISQSPGYFQRALDDLLALEEVTVTVLDNTLMKQIKIAQIKKECTSATFLDLWLNASYSHFLNVRHSLALSLHLLEF